MCSTSAARLHNPPGQQGRGSGGQTSEDVRRVLVPVVAAESVAHLTLLATALAGSGGTIVAVSVVTDAVDRAAVTNAEQVVARVTEAVTDPTVRVEPVVVVADDVAEAVHDAAAARDIDLVVMGWAGSTSGRNAAFGAIVDQVVGRSRVPLLMVRPGTQEPTGVLLAFDTDQLHPSGRRGLVLAADVAATLRARRDWPLTLLQTGEIDGPELPPAVLALSDRVHHDPRRRHQALASSAHAGMVVVAPVAPSIAGLRSATSRINWAAGDATLAVAVDVGPVDAPGDLSTASAPSLRLVAPDAARTRRAHGVAITASAPTPIDRRRVVDALRPLGEVSSIRTWWDHDGTPRLSLVVAVVEESDSLAIGRVMEVVDTLGALSGARVRYDLVEVPTPLRVQRLEPLGIDDVWT